MPGFADRIAGGVCGLLVGDALGVPFEFKSPDEIPAHDEIELEPPRGYPRSHAGVLPGTWSDDGAHALCLLASLLECGRLDLDDLAERLVAWYERGDYAVDGIVFDVGVRTSAAIRSYREGVPATECGGNDVHGNGNGSLMRVLPLALWHRGSDAELVRDARRQSLVTHGHVRSQVCCALYCLWARRILHDDVDPWNDAVATLRTLLTGDDDATAELEFHIRPDEEPEGKGSGYVVDCLRSARLALQQPTYEDVVRAAIRLGHDTDTTACVAGGIAGVRDGLHAIPLRWLDRLRGRDLAEPWIQALLTSR